MASNHDEPTKKELALDQTSNPPIPPNDNHENHLQNLNRVRRRLDFGCDSSGDTNQTDQELCLPLEVIQSDRQRAIEKWNFDFENEVPLEGDWVWEKVNVEEPCENLQVISAMEEKQVDNRSV